MSQAPSPPSDTATIHVDTDLIQVPIVALHPPFIPALGLTRDNLTIRLDGGTPFHPSYLRTEGDESIGLAVVVDVDTRAPQLLSQGLQAALQGWPANLLHSSDRLSFYIYGCHLIQSLDNAPADLNEYRRPIVNAASLSDFQRATEGGKACQKPPLEDVLSLVTDRIAKEAEWKVLLLIMNGDRYADSDSLRKVQSIAAAESVSVFAVKYVDRNDFPSSVYSATEGINVLVSSLGGVSIHSSLDDLGEVSQNLIKLFRQRYILSFPRPGNGSVGAHRLEVSTNMKGIIIRSSAASAPVLDTSHCKEADGKWVCSQQRPEYGNQRPNK